MKRLIVITIIFFFTVTSINLISQERRVQVTEKEKRLALIIGNNNYSTGRLANAVNDARSIKDTLKDLGFSVIYLENASLRRMTTSVQELERKLKAGGVGLFYFSGHGIQIEGLNYLLPVGANVKSEADVEFECYPADRVIESMTNARNRLNIVILDACRDNPFSRSFSRSSTKGLAQMSSGKGMMIAYSTSPGDTASDGPGMQNGLFTHHLLKSMKTPGLNLEQVFKKTREAVNKASNGNQLPWTSSSVIGDFFFNQKSSVILDQIQEIQIEPSRIEKVDLVEFESGPVEVPKNEQEWSVWQTKLNNYMQKAKAREGKIEISFPLKREAWKKILEVFNLNNPYTNEDDDFKTFIKNRIHFWNNIQDLRNKLRPAVVEIQVSSAMTDNLDKFFNIPKTKKTQKNGSGFFISPDGYLLTTYDLVRDAKRIKVIDISWQEYPAVIIGSDEKSNIALLKIKEKEFPYLMFGDSDKVKDGDWILQVAYRDDHNLLTMYVDEKKSAQKQSDSFLERYFNIQKKIYYDRVISTKVGSTGCPLLSLNGEIIGMISSIDTSKADGFGTGYMIKSNRIKRIIRDLKVFGSVKRGYLGINVYTINEQDRHKLDLSSTGALIKEVMPRSPAKKAGLKKYDLIIEVKNLRINTAEELRDTIQFLRPGEIIKITVIRKDNKKAIYVKLGEEPVKKN